MKVKVHNFRMPKMAMLSLAFLASVFILVISGCDPDDDPPVADVNFSDQFESDPGNWTLNEALNFYKNVTVDINSTYAGKLRMSAHPDTTNYTGTYTGMAAMTYENAVKIDTPYTLQVDAEFINRPVSALADKQAEILIYFNVFNTQSFDCLKLYSNNTWDLQVYKNLVPLSAGAYTDYAPVVGATLPTGAFNLDGNNTIIITQNANTVSISLNGVALAVPAYWPYAGYNVDVQLGLGFKYESGVPATHTGAVEGPIVVFDNFSVVENS